MKQRTRNLLYFIKEFIKAIFKFDKDEIIDNWEWILLYFRGKKSKEKK